MALLPTNPRDRNLVLVGLLAIGLAAVYHQMYWTSENRRLNAIEVRLDTLDSLNRIARLEYAKGSVTKMQQEGDGYARELSVLRRLVPTENEVPALLESISTAARRAGLELVDIQPDGVVKGESFDTYKYKLGVTGPYHQVAAFLTNIGSLSRIVSPINVSLAPMTRPGELRQKTGEQFLDARFGVQTYVARAVPRPAPGERSTPDKPGAP
jgi:type IV pilus assembly protein PilO